MNFPDELPQHLWRFPTKAAKAHLANRFNLPLEDWMQDWEYTAPRVEQLPEYLEAYKSGYLSEDQQFLLMQLMIQCAEDEPEKFYSASVIRLLEEDIELHFYSVWYWAVTEHIGEDPEFSWDISPAMREILWRHRELWT